MAAKPEFEALTRIPADQVDVARRTFDAAGSATDHIQVSGPATDGIDPTIVCIFWHVDQGGNVVAGVTKPKETGKEECGVKMYAFEDTQEMHAKWNLSKPAVVVGVEVRVLHGSDADPELDCYRLESYTWSDVLLFEEVER